MMCDKELLVGYLYDELDASERATFEAHVRSCAACREEVGDLRETRARLTLWAPPEPDFGFQIVRGAVPPRPARTAALRTWGLAAAAMLVLAASAAIANLDIRYDANGLVVRTGWARPAAPATVTASTDAAPAAPASEASEQWKASLAALDRRLGELERERPPAGAVPADGTRLSDADVIRLVRRIVSESEARQERAVARRVGQLWTDVGAMRAADLARIEQELRQVQGVTNAELIQHRNTLNQLWRVSQQR
jgi:anti-sigma factor RsiW